MSILLSCSCLMLAVLAVLVSSDSDPLRELCVADNDFKVFVDGVVCKDPSKLTSNDFFSSSLTKPINTSNALNVDVTLVDVSVFPGLNTQGLSLARLAFGPNGVNPPHNHPRSAEVLYVVEGVLQAGFISENRLFQKVVRPGEMFIFPRGLVHFQWNLSPDKPALAIAALGSQNPGRTDLALALFTTTPPISNEVLEVSLQVKKGEIEHLRKQVEKTSSASGQNPGAAGDICLL